MLATLVRCALFVLKKNNDYDVLNYTTVTLLFTTHCPLYLTIFLQNLINRNTHRFVKLSDYNNYDKKLIKLKMFVAMYIFVQNDTSAYINICYCYELNSNIVFCYFITNDICFQCKTLLLFFIFMRAV